MIKCVAFVRPVVGGVWVLRVGFKGWAFFTVAFNERVSVRCITRREGTRGNLLFNVVAVVFFLLVFRVELREVNLESSHWAGVSIGVEPDALWVLAANCDAGLIPGRTVGISVSRSYWGE
jgi:hypothetical protein